MCNIKELPAIPGLTKKDVNVNGDKVHMRDKVKWIKVSTFGSYQYKHLFDEDEPWKTVQLVRHNFGSPLAPDDIVHISVIPVTQHAVNKSKILDIIQQLQYIPAVFHNYYKNVIERVDDE